MYKLSEAEWAVLEVLWGAESFLLGELAEALGRERKWSRNTVHTYLTRMEGKGLVQIDRESEPHRYAAAVSRELCAHQARSALLNGVYGGAAGDLIAAFLKESTITPEERERLRAMLDKMEV